MTSWISAVISSTSFEFSTSSSDRGLASSCSSSRRCARLIFRSTSVRYLVSSRSSSCSYPQSCASFCASYSSLSLGRCSCAHGPRSILVFWNRSCGHRPQRNGLHTRGCRKSAMSSSGLSPSRLRPMRLSSSARCSSIAPAVELPMGCRLLVKYVSRKELSGCPATCRAGESDNWNHLESEVLPAKPVSTGMPCNSPC